MAGSARVFRFGAFEVDAGSGELRKQGIRIRLQEQPFQLLLMLLARPGEIVTREEIRSKLWPPDTFVDFEQAIGTALKKLRQALNDDAEEPQYIETVPKRGYRFLAPVEGVQAKTEAPHLEPASSKGQVQAKTPARRRKALVAAAAGSVLVLILGIEFAEKIYAPAKSESTAAPAEPRPLTTFPGGEYEPALSPDGQSIAFVWWDGGEFFHIYTQMIDVGSPVRLTQNFRTEDSPTWSPDGRYIAFVTMTEDPQVSGVYIAPAFGGAPRKLASLAPRRIFDRQLDWSPDGNSLAIVDRESIGKPFAIYLLSLNSGVRRQLTTPPGAIFGDSGPAFSPDGRQIVFRRTEGIGVNDLYIISSSGGTARRLTFDRRFTSGHAWTADGRSIVFASKRSGVEALWRIEASGGSPVRLPGATEGAYNVAISRSGNRLAYSQYRTTSTIWETDLTTGRVTRRVASSRNDRSPQYSPDGTRIAFRSDRSGTDEIWVSEASGENAQRLTSFDGPLTGTPRWSPDGQFITFDSRPNGNPDIYVVGANGGPPRRVTSSPAEDVVPSWSKDGRWIYFASNRSGSWQVWKIASDTTAEQSPPVQVTRQGGFAAFESLDEKTIFYAKGRDRAGLWQVPVTGGQEQPLIPSLKAGYWGYWGVARDELFFINPLPAGKAEVDAYQFVTGRIRRVSVLDHDPPFSDSGFSVTRDGSKILFSQVDSSMSDIMLVENFH